MELHFLGTGSAFPSPKRSSSCTALRHDKGVWLFDCGEGSQIQLQKSTLKPGRIKKIFITHLHGDHLFGLPGLMCTIGQNGAAVLKPHIDLYGPIGLRNFICMSLTLSYSNLPYTFSVHEVMIPSYEEFHSTNHVDKYDPEFWNKLKNLSKIELPLHPNEIAATKIYTNQQNIFEICYDDDLTVLAGVLQHTVPCIGYVIQEDNIPGTLNVKLLKDIGITPGPVYGQIKSGKGVTLPCGKIVNPQDYIGEERKGRKLVILGDTYDSTGMLDIAMNADVLVQESTNENADQEKSIQHGHSTAGMAGEFASKIFAQKLILTHFSQRYRSLDYEIAEETIDVLVKQAKETFSDTVIAAEDLLVVPVPLAAR